MVFLNYSTPTLCEIFCCTLLSVRYPVLFMSFLVCILPLASYAYAHTSSNQNAGSRDSRKVRLCARYCSYRSLSSRHEKYRTAVDNSRELEMNFCSLFYKFTCIKVLAFRQSFHREQDAHLCYAVFPTQANHLTDITLHV